MEGITFAVSHVCEEMGREHFAVGIHKPVKPAEGLCRATAKCFLPVYFYKGDTNQAR
jgi:hypothetical protein